MASLRTIARLTLLLLCTSFLSCSLALNFGYCDSYLKNVKSICPSPETIGGVQLKSYLGRWFEIGSSAQFKIRPFNENGLICITANYSVTKETNDRFELAALNRGLLVTSPSLQNLVQLVSSSAYNSIERLGVICRTSASVLQSLESSSIQEYLGAVSALPSSLRPKAEVLFDSLLLLPLRLSKLSGNIDRYVRASQVKVGRISQGGGASTKRLVNSVLKQARRIDVALELMSRTIKQVDNLALEYQQLIKATSPTQYSAVIARIEGLRNLTSPVGQLVSSVGALKGFNAITRTQIRNTSRNLAPFQIPIGVTLQATQTNPAESGKLNVGFPGTPPAAYWIIDLKGSAASNYEVSLVWTCSNFSSPSTLRSSGNIAGQQQVFLLSRTPTLPEKVVSDVLNNAKKKGVYFSSDNPFIPTIQTKTRCEAYLDSIY